jgi:hypothetical protein
MMVPRPRRVSPLTETAPSWLTIPARRLLAAGQSGSGAPSGSRTPCSAAWFTVRKTSAACSSDLAGMHPRCRQVPPTLSFSTMATDNPAEAAYSAAA